MSKPNETIKVVIDKVTMLPLCVNLHAGMGIKLEGPIRDVAELWQVTPAAEPYVVAGTCEQWLDWITKRIQQIRHETSSKDATA